MKTEAETMSRDGNISNIKHGRRRVRFLFQAAAAVMASITLLAVTLNALADDPPVLTISNLGSNQFSVVITNAASPTNYLLEWTPILADTNYPWLVVATNEPGATNWVMDMGPWPMGYLRIAVGWDSDGDSIPDWIDAQPYNSSVGALNVTIDSPLNGSAFY